MANQAPNLMLKLLTNDLGTDKNLTKDFQAIFEKHNGNWDEMKPKLKSDKAFSEELVDKLEFTQNLAVLSNGNSAFVKHFQDNNATNSLAEIGLTQNKLDIAKIMGKDLEDPEVSKTWSSLYVKVPNAALAYQINNPDIPLLNNEVGKNIAKILTKQTDFNILQDSVYDVFETTDVFKDIAPELHAEVITQMKTLQRVARISPAPEVIPALINANFTTGLRVSEMPKSQFVAYMANNGLTEDQAHNIHEAATLRMETFQHTLMGAKEAIKGTGVAFIDKSINATRVETKKMMMRMGGNDLADNEEIAFIPIIGGGTAEPERQSTSTKKTLNWDTLFADADLCECGECTSVYSAASYFVELLQYLRNNNLDGETLDGDGNPKYKIGEKDIIGTALQALFNRRPDLGCLELTCKNTNTILPYVDLVNEVLEQFIVFDDAKKLKAFNVADEASSELLAQAQHTNYDAYCNLSKAVYPFNLPYHQPIDAIRVFLEFLETSRYELMNTFPSPRKSTGTIELDPTDGDEGTVNPTAEREKELNGLHTKYLERATDAEFLGITQDEYVILTQEAFISHEHWDKQCDKIHSKEEYETAIHLKPTHEYFGYNSEDLEISKAEMLDTTEGSDGLTFVKKNFLPRTGILYADLVELLKTQYLNPNLPTGKSLSIMEGFKFSYRYLASLSKEDRIKALIDPDKWMEAIANKENLPYKKPEPNHCEDETDCVCIDKKEIERLVKCEFERVGKMIVLENGCECVNGILNFKFLFSYYEDDFDVEIKDCNILITQQRVLNPVTKNIGQIDCLTGIIIIPDSDYLYNFEKESVPEFFGFRGEIGKIIYDEVQSEYFLIDKITNLPFSQSPKETCNIDTVELKHLNGSSLSVEEYDHFHRFIRLQKKMGWTIDETDKAIMALSKPESNNGCGEGMPDNDACESPIGDVGCGCQNTESDCGCDDCNELKQAIGDINPTLIHQLVAVKKLLEITGLELIKLLAFWTDISTVGEKSLYARLLLTHNLLGMDKVFKADGNGNFLVGTEKISKHIPVLMAAFNLTADDINDIIKDAKITDELTLSNISLLYRYRLLVKVLGLRVAGFITAYPIFDEKPFLDAYTTLQFMENWAKMEDTGFDFKHLNYIIKNKDDERKPLAPNQKTILQLAKTLYDGLNGIDAAHPDLVAIVDESVKTILDKKLSIQNQATSEFVKTKIALLFDVESTEAIIALLEGTTISKYFMPKGLGIKVDQTNDLLKKLKYDNTKGGITLTGIVSEIEKTAILALSTSEDWQSGIEKADFKSTKIFDDLLLPIFKDEAQRNQVKSELLIPDILTEPKLLFNPDGTPTLDGEDNQKSEPDLRTAPSKRVAFINVFLPYLRKKLSYKFIITTIGGVSGLDDKTTEFLVTKILNHGGTSLLLIFEKIKATTDSSTNWSGDLIPTTDGEYTFVVETDIAGFNTNSFSIKFEGESALEFIEKTDIKKEFWTKSAKKLKAGQIYKLTITGLGSELVGLSWKTGSTQLAKIPNTLLLPDHASEDTKIAITSLQKAAMLINGFNLNAEEIDFLNTNKADFSGLDFNTFLTEHWLRLEAYTRFRNSLPETKTNLLEFLQWNVAVKEDVEKAKLSQKIADLTFWKKEPIDKLIEETHFNINVVVHFRDERNLLKLQKAIAVANKVNVAIDMLFDWAKPSTNFGVCRTISENIRNVVRSKYSQTDWEQVVKPLNDKLRENQKNAFISYLMVDENIPARYRTDANGLFEFFLIDVQMDACMETSRIKQAISSVQLFVQRCFLGLEEDNNPKISPSTLDRKRWDWMQRYRVWEANRKVFLYPENWIESNLRDDKSPFFKELESELLQKDITKQNVTDALKNYLYKVDEVANMEVVGLYIDGEQTNKKWSSGAKLHVFSRTRNAPYFFYYRYLELDTMNWYPWEKMQVDIPSYEGEHSLEQWIFIKKVNSVTTNSIDVDLSLFPPSNPKSKNIINQSINVDTSELKKGQESGFLRALSLTLKFNISDGHIITKNTTQPIINSYSTIFNGLIFIEKITIAEDRKLNSTDIEADTTGRLKATFYKDKINNGCFLIPVVWNSRLLVFFPQIVKKTLPNTDIKNKKIVAIANENSPEDSTPIEYYEIKMAWSEYRNGKWTQKQVSTSSINSVPKDISHDIEYFKFIPIVSQQNVILKIDDFLDPEPDAGFAPNVFVFDGNSIYSNPQTDDDKNNIGEPIEIDSFHKKAHEIQSWQLSKENDNKFHISNKIIKFSNEGTITGVRNASNFYHLDTHNLLGLINLGQLEKLFQYNLSDKINKLEAFGGDTKSVYHELKRPYSLYNWELFFHTPILLADTLSKSQQFEEAMKWFHYVFNPMADGDEDIRFWGFAPFKDLDAKSVLDKLFNQLEPNKAAGEDITEWRNKPFMPHVVARNRPVAYMKWVVMKYTDNLVAWGDYLFRQDTIESINQATQLYVLGYHILGQRPQFIPKRGKTKPQSYMSLLNKWDAYGNAVTELELYAPFSNQVLTPAVRNADGEIAFANVFGMASSLYFCIPNNPKLTGYWDTIEDRLYKIRHCENIEGVFRKLPLFEPPIDPALLVRAAANGLSIGSVLNDLNTPMPNYRFYYLLQKALELCNELKSLGGAMLSAIEKKDNEAIAIIRAKHEGTMQNLLMEIKTKQLEEAQKAVEGLERNRKSPEHRMKYYLQLIGEDVNKVPSFDSDFTELANPIQAPVEESGLKISPFENEEMDRAEEAIWLQTASGVVELLSSILFAVPDVTAFAAPLGVGAAVKTGGSSWGAVSSAVAKGLQIGSSILSYQSTSAGRKGGFQRAIQDRTMQANSAGHELKQIDKQIISQKIRIDIANQEIINQQKQIDNSQEIEEFLKNKYTNDELYTWMKGNLKTLYHQVYSLAYELAKKAEKVYRFERGLTSTNFIQGNYWDAGREGLLSGEQLYVGLKQLEAAYHENRGYDYEITKHVSVRQINPLQILQLKETGKCEFDLPEVLFDMDYPGHYKRRIKSVSISIPCVVGPYTGLNATLRLLQNKFRNSAIPNSYKEKTEETDERFLTWQVPISAISASSGQNESGMFELNFKDERYLPFEGAGVISKWRLELPDIHQFDYETISDVVVHIRYTSAEGGERLKKEALKEVNNFMRSTEDLAKEEGLFTIIDINHDLATEWHKAIISEKVDNKYHLDLKRVNDYIPYFTTLSKTKYGVSKVYLITNSKEEEIANPLVGDISTWELSQEAKFIKEDRMWLVVKFHI